MYIANTYIGSAYTPGEIIHDDIPSEMLEWLIKAGAVKETAPAPIATVEEPTFGDAPQEKPQEIEDDEIEAEDEGDEIAEEIDVMAGIVRGAEDAPEDSPVADAPNGKKAPKGGKAK